MDGLTGRILYQKQAGEKSLIASTTKIMTALLVCERCNVLETVQIPPQAVGIEGSSMYLQAGERLTVQELLYGMMLCSGNDAATALAIHCGGSVENFAAMMNDRAEALKLRNTHFANPHGLDAAEHYSTAYDLAVLASAAMENPIFARTVSAKTRTVGARRLVNHNKLLWQVAGAEGVKTGFTRAAGRILVSSVCREGRRLIAVTIDDGNDWADHATLYQQGFGRFTLCSAVQPGQCLGRLAVFGGTEEHVRVYAAQGFSFPLTQDEKLTVRLSRKGMTFAPVVAGADAGVAYLCLGQKVVGKVALTYGETIEMPPEPERKSLWRRWFGEKYD